MSGVTVTSMTCSPMPRTSRAEAPGAAVPGGQHHDPGVVVAEAELALGADHAVGDVAVRLAAGDREPARQHRPGQRDDDEVAGGEVARAADDPALAGVSAWPLPSPTSTRQNRIGFLNSVSSVTSSTRPTTSGPVSPSPTVRISSTSSPARTRCSAIVSTGSVGGDVDVLAQPRQGDAHQTSDPNSRVNRTSPSNMSRMSRHVVGGT